MEAIPSPRPVKPIPSVVVAFTFTIGLPEIRPCMLVSISFINGLKRGDSAIIVASTLTTIQPLIVRR